MNTQANEIDNQLKAKQNLLRNSNNLLKNFFNEINKVKLNYKKLT